MSEPAASANGPSSLLALYDNALPRVYGYLSARCGRAAIAEDLTAETFLAAVDAVRSDNPPALSVPWIMGVARHKLVDHWRRRAREERSLQVLDDDTAAATEDWDIRLDALRARETLETLGAHHRAALTLRYLDDLSVPEVAALLDRSVHATEALLVRARLAFKRAYTEKEGTDD